MKPTVRLFSFGRSTLAHDNLIAAMQLFCVRPPQSEVLAYSSEAQSYLHKTCPQLRALASATSMSLLPGSLGLWVIENTNTIHPEERAMLRLFSVAGMREVILFVQSRDLNDEAIDVTEVALREALLEAGFSGDEASIIRGDVRDAAWGPNARIVSFKLLELLDIKGLSPVDDGMSLLAVVDSTAPSSPGVVVRARALRGCIKVASLISVFDGVKLLEVKVQSLLRHDYLIVSKVMAPDDFSFELFGDDSSRMKRDCVLGLPGQLVLSERVEVELFVFPHPKGSTPLKRQVNERFVLVLPYGSVKVTLEAGSLVAGSMSVVTLRASEPWVLAPGILFELRSKKELLAVGVIPLA
jgi:elongation factor Tu